MQPRWKERFSSPGRTVYLWLCEKKEGVSKADDPVVDGNELLHVSPGNTFSLSETGHPGGFLLSATFTN